MNIRIRPAWPGRTRELSSWRLMLALSLVTCLGAFFQFSSELARAKVPPAEIVIGGRDLGPYYHAISTDSPDGFQLYSYDDPYNGGTSFGDPVIPDFVPPGDLDALLRESYDLWWGFCVCMTTGHPEGRYIRANDHHPAYLYWQGPERGPDLRFQISQTFSDTWYEVQPDAARLLDAAIADARLRVENGGRGLARDPVSAFAGLLTSSPASGAYVIGLGINGAMGDETDPWMDIPLAQSEALVDGFVETLHNWRPVDFRETYLPTSFDVWTGDGRHFFAIENVDSASPHLVAFGYSFDVDPGLLAVLEAAIVQRQPVSAAASSWEQLPPYSIWSIAATVFDEDETAREAPLLDLLLNHRLFAWLRTGSYLLGPVAANHETTGRQSIDGLSALDLPHQLAASLARHGVSFEPVIFSHRVVTDKGAVLFDYAPGPGATGGWLRVPGLGFLFPTSAALDALLRSAVATFESEGTLRGSLLGYRP